MAQSTILTLEDLRARREEILQIARSHGARNLRIFGSVATNDARPQSDIDFLVEMESGRGVLDISELILDLQDALGRDVDVVEIRRPSATADAIQRQAVPL